MTCKEFVNSVTDYLDDALASHHRAEFDHHRESCANCQTYFKQMNQLIRAAPFLQEDPGKITVPLRLYELLAEKTRVPSRELGLNRLGYNAALMAIAAILIGAGIWVYRSRYATTPAPKSVTIDLSHWLHLRGADQAPHPPIELPRAKLNLTVLLPIGAESGIYHLGVSSKEGEPFLTGVGTATLIDHVETLHVGLDLTRVSRGAYFFGVRRASSQWTYYPLTVK